MNWKKNLLHIMVTGVILIGGIFIAPTSQASIESPGKFLQMNTPTYRKSNYAYKVGIKGKNLDMWKIYEYNKIGGSIKNQNNAIYCLKMGVGFGSVEGSPTEPRTYQKYANMKNPKEEDKYIINSYKEKLSDSQQLQEENYNSIIWILDHCYVPETSEHPSDKDTQQARENKKQLLEAAGIEQDSFLYKDDDMSNDLIDIVQQLAIWYFTNDSDYQADSFNVTCAKKMDTLPSYKSLSDVIGRDYLEISEELIALYNYFVNNAKDNKDTPPSTDDVTNPIKLVSDEATVTLHKDSSGQYYLAGPYKIEQLTDKEFTINEMTVNGSKSYTLLDNSKQANGTIENFATTEEQFYVKIPKQADTNIENVELKITTKIKQNTITYWEVNNSSLATEQPVAIIEPQEKTFETTVSSNVLNFDLALRKFITAVNDKPVNNPTREPDVQEDTLKSNTTATKTHTKKPVEVKPGDKVKYTIRIYNEGEVSGYATKVVDYLPSGLELDSSSEINRTNGWTQGEGNSIVSTNLQSKLIPKYDSGQGVQYQELEVECIVKAQNSANEQRFKNVAEITEAKDEHDQIIVDRDSQPNSLDQSLRGSAYNAQYSEQGWGYQDDDDYEELVIPGKTFDLALRKFIEKVNNVDVPQTREPDVKEETLTDGKTTATKEHIKTPVEVKPGDTILYRIRVYNEGDLSGYATKVVDYLPEGLELTKNSQINTNNGWQEGEGNSIVSTNLQDKLIEGYISGNEIQYQDLQVECTVTAKYLASRQTLKNVAEIVEARCSDNSATDRDSQPNSLQTSQKGSGYNAPDSEKGWGYQDDDDYEELVIPGKTFDLALRKFVEKVNNEIVAPTRVPDVKEETLTGDKTTARKEHIKTPVEVKPGDTIIYTIRVYNEGDLSGYATKVVDYLPEGLELTEGSDINTDNKWEQEGNKITSTKLQNELIEGYVNGQEMKYKDLQVECTVTAKFTTSEQSLKNVAEIVAATCKDNPAITDKDSTPDNLKDEEKNNYNPGESTQGWGYEDDDDYEELVIPARSFDLALRKFVTQVGERELNREPNITLDPLINNTDKTAIYNHRKDPVGVSAGDIVIYTIRIYNEGQLDGYVSEVTDYLPPQLEFVTDDEENFNAKYGWTIDKSLRKATTRLFERKQDDNGIYTDENEENMLKAFDGQHLDSKELKIKCRVVETVTRDSIITNIAEITEFTDAQGNVVTDRDSQKKNANIPDDDDLMDYKGNESNKSILTDENYFYKGQEDDDDFEKLIVQEFDLALRKFITKVNDTPITSREPKFTNVKDDNGNYIYEHSKEPIEVETTDTIEYTIRIFNEGDIAGYAKEITDNIPQGLEFLPNNETNKEYGWVMLDENGEPTENVEEAVKITTNYLSKEQEQESESRDNLIEAFDSTKTSPDYKDVKVAFKVVASNTYTGIITNIAEISDDSDDTGDEVDDKDSTPDNNDENEDDIDEEHVKLTYFDLALRKFITAVNDKEITSRVPQFKVTEDGKYTYEHSKEPVEVENGNIVTYTLRVYNEGTKDGYAKEIKDDLPEGLEFLPENEINEEYEWIMLDENGEPTENIEEAVAITTHYLSKEQGDLNERDNLLKKFDPTTMEEPDYRDVKIAFKVTEPNTSDRILINQAQISDDSDKDGKDVIDEDSTPDKWIEDEDDQDTEKVKVKYFDLSLRKWVTETIVIDEGKETVTPTGHKAEDDPEELVKVEIKESRLNKVVVKFRYKIRVTNEGEIAGYATEISDYIPDGLKFVQEDNPDWKEVDGKIVTEALKDTLLQPGETAEVEVLLTWINGKNNFGEKINVAEISKDKNDSDTPDIDSTPDNKEPDEDDIDDAPVILSVKTGIGANMQYITIATISLGILATGVILIKKYIL